jgi:exopolysaccharide production protein ExoQ
MPPELAAVIFALGILGLCLFDRDPKVRTSKALWVPVLWFLIVGSREVSRWLEVFGMGAGAINDEYVEGNPIDRVIYAGLLALGLALLFGRGRRLRRLLRANWPLLLFYCYCAISILWSDYPDIAFKRWVKAIGDVVMVMIVLTEADQSAAIKRFLTRPAFLLIPLSILLIKYYPNVGREYKMWLGTPVYSGVATHKNILGVICLLFGLICEWNILNAYQSREQKRRTLSIVANTVVLAMSFWLFWKASSMTSLSCFLLAGGLMAATCFRTVTRTPMLVHVLVVIVVAIPLATLFFDMGGGSLEAMGKDSTLTGRTALWDLVLRLSGNPLIGTGFESFWLGSRRETIWNLYWWHPNEAHNGYLEMFLNLGYVGLTLLGIMVFTGYRNIIGAFRSDPDLARLKLAYFVVAIIYNFTEAGFRMMYPVWITFLLAIMAVPKARVSFDERHQSPRQDVYKPEPDRELFLISGRDEF